MQLSSFKTYVKQDFKRTDKDTELVQAYNDMLNWVTVFMPHGNYKFQSYVSTIVGTEDYALPSNIIHLIHPIRFLLGTGASDDGYPLDHITKQEYDFREPNPNKTNPPKGRPSAYTIFSRSILVTPIPDLATYYLEINWSKRRTEMSADGDLPSLGSEWDEVLKWGTLERLYAGMGLVEESALFGAKYHAINPSNGMDVPVGLCATLFDVEKDMEGDHIGQVQFNDL